MRRGALLLVLVYSKTFSILRYDVADLANDVSSVLPAPHAQPIALEREYVMYKVNVLLITETLLPSVA